MTENITDKGEGIPEAEIRRIVGAANLMLSTKNRLKKVDSRIAFSHGFIQGAKYEHLHHLRSLSPSIDRYPRWVRADMRLPPKDWGKRYIVRSLMHKDIVFSEMNLGHFECWGSGPNTYANTEWLEEEQPFESPAITDNK